jgi:hypothetical protein
VHKCRSLFGHIDISKHQQTSENVNKCQQMSANVSKCQQTSANVSIDVDFVLEKNLSSQQVSANVSRFVFCQQESAQC